MGLISAESVRAHHGTPLTPSVAKDNDDRRRLMPIGLGLVEAQRFVRIVFHLVRGMAQIVLALLLHPENKIGIVFRISVAQLFFDLRVGNDDKLPGLGVGAG